MEKEKEFSDRFKIAVQIRIELDEMDKGCFTKEEREYYRKMLEAEYGLHTA